MLNYSANNRTFYRCKSECINWLRLEFLNRTFSIQEDDPEIDVYEIRQLLSDDP